MNVVHRCRFTDWQPSAILSLTIAASGTKFAALRVNGNIEVWTQIVQDNPDSVLAVNDNGVKYELSSFLSRFQPLHPSQPDSTTTTNQQSSTQSTGTALSTSPTTTLEDNAYRLASTQEHLYRYASIYYLSSQWVCTSMIPGTGKNVFTQLLWSFVDPVANPQLVPDFKPNALTTSSTSKQSQIIDRLFTLGSNGRIVEWDLFSSLPKFSTQSHGRALSCGSVSPSGAQLAVGCQDGTVRIFKIADATSEPLLITTLNRHKGRVISIDWLHFAHINPPQKPTLTQQHHRPGTVKSNAHQRVEDSSWWDPPLLCSGGTDGYLKVWNAVTKTCTLQLKADALRFDVSKHSDNKKKLLQRLKASGNKAFLKETGLKTIAMKGKQLKGDESRKEFKKNLLRLKSNLGNSMKSDRHSLANATKTIGDKERKAKLMALRDGTNDFSSESEMEDEDQEDFGDEDEDDFNEDEDDDMNDGLSDDEMVDDQEVSEDDQDVGLMPSSKTNHSKKAGDKEIHLGKVKDYRKVVRSGGRVKTNNHVIKVKWLDVETIVFLDQTSQLMVVNARSGVITSRFSLQQSLVSPTDLAIIPATLHTRSIAHPHNISYESRYSYQVHPGNVVPGREHQLLQSIFTPPAAQESFNPQQNSNTALIPPPQYIPAFKSNQVYVPHPVIYVSGVNGRVIELTGTKSLDLSDSQKSRDASTSPFANTIKFISTGLHGVHTHDIISLTLAPTLITTHQSKNGVAQRTSQLTLLSSGVDTVITSYSIHPFNIPDPNIIKTYFQYVKPIKLKILSNPPEISLSNYTSPWSHHWTLGKHQAALNDEQYQQMVKSFQDSKSIHPNYISSQALLERTLVETPYHIKTIPGINTLQHFPMCVCPKCKLANIPSILNSNITLRLLYSIHLIPSTHQKTYGVKVSNVGNGAISSFTQDKEKSTYYEPFFLYNKADFEKKKPQTSLLSYIPLNSIEMSYQYGESDANQIKQSLGNTIRVYSPRLINLLKTSPTLQYIQQPAPTNPVFAYPREFSIDLYTLTNQDQLLVRDKYLLDKNTQLNCSPVELNNILCDMQLYQGTVILDRNAVMATLLTMYTLRSAQQQHFLKQKSRLEKHQQLNDPHLVALDKEYAYHQSNPHLFRDNVKLGHWQFHEPAFGLSQHPAATYQSTTPTIDSTDSERRAVSVSEDEPLRMLPSGKLAKIPTDATLPSYVLSLRIALANVSATTSTQLSPNGRLLLASDATTIKLWGLSCGAEKIGPNAHKKKTSDQMHKNAITPTKIQFPPPVPSLTQYLRSVFSLPNDDGDEGANNFDLNSIPDHLYEQCVEEHHLIELFSQLLEENGCTTAAFSPCSSMLAISLTPYAGAIPQSTSNYNIFDAPSEGDIALGQYPHLGAVILIDLVTYQIIGFIKRNKITLFSKVTGICLPSKATMSSIPQNGVAPKGTLVSVMREHYKDQYQQQFQKVSHQSMFQTHSKTKDGKDSAPRRLRKQQLATDKSMALLEVTQRYSTTCALPEGGVGGEMSDNKLSKKTSSFKMTDDSTDGSSSSSDSDSDSSSDSSDSDDDSDDDDHGRYNKRTNDSSSKLFNAMGDNENRNSCDEKPTKFDLISQIHFSPCGRYISTLDNNNSIRLYQLLDKCFTPAMVHVQTISSIQDDISTQSTNSTKSTTSSQCISSYQLLPTVTDLKQSHLAQTLQSDSGIDQDQLVQTTNSKKLLDKVIGPSRLDRVLKTLFKWATTAAQQHQNSKSDTPVEIATSSSNKIQEAKRSLFKRTAVAATTTTNQKGSSLNQNTNSTNPSTQSTKNGFVVKNDEDVNSDDDDYNEKEATLQQLNPKMFVQLGIDPTCLENSTNSMNDEETPANNETGDSFRLDNDVAWNQKKSMATWFDQVRRNVRVDTEGYNPHHLLTELLHLLLLSQFTTPISRLFLSLKSTKRDAKVAAPGQRFMKLLKEKINNFVTLPKCSARSSFLLNPINFDYEIYPSICGSYSNGHYFVYDSNSRSYLGYDTMRPQEIGIKNSNSDSKQGDKSDLTDSTSRNHLVAAATSLSKKDTVNNNNNNANSTSFDPLIPPKRENYYSQVMPFKETATFNELNTNIPSLLHADVAPIFSTSQHTNYRPLVSYDDSAVLKNCSVMGGLLSSFNIIFATNDDSYTLSLPLHRVYPSIFKQIISSAYYQVIDVIMILEKLNNDLISTSFTKDSTISSTSTPVKNDTEDIASSSTKQPTKRRRPDASAVSTAVVVKGKNGGVEEGQNANISTVSRSDIDSATLLKIGQLQNIHHQQRIELLMAECLSLLPIQRLKSIGRYRPILHFKFLNTQPSTEVGSMKSLFYYVNNVMTTYYNYDLLPSAPIRPVYGQNANNNTKPKNLSDSDNDDDGDDYSVGKVKITKNKNNNVGNIPGSHQTPATLANGGLCNATNAHHYIGFNSNDATNVTLNTPSVVVEAPWIQVINSLPPAAYKKKWGKL